MSEPQYETKENVGFAIFFTIVAIAIISYSIVKKIDQLDLRIQHLEQRSSQCQIK